ncbi:MAG: hypothetical protein AVDCRST_MAG79-2082, partial [uncultured Thermoleophilia bacterium]
ARRADDCGGQGGARPRALQRLPAPAYDGRADAIARPSTGNGGTGPRRAEHRDRAGGVGAVLVSLPRRPRRRFGACRPPGQGRRAGRHRRGAAQVERGARRRRQSGDRSGARM